MGNRRVVIAVVSLIVIGILWLVAVGAFANPRAHEYGRVGGGLLMIALGLHLIFFRREHSAFWRRENRAFWGRSFIGDLLEQQYTSEMIAIFGMIAVILGVIFLLIRG